MHIELFYMQLNVNETTFKIMNPSGISNAVDFQL